jgi:hypothetical protein
VSSSMVTTDAETQRGNNFQNDSMIALPASSTPGPI